MASCFENFASCRENEVGVYLANSHFDSITWCEELLLLCIPQTEGMSCSTGGVHRVVGTAERRGEEMTEFA